MLIGGLFGCHRAVLRSEWEEMQVVTAEKFSHARYGLTLPRSLAPSLPLFGSFSLAGVVGGVLGDDGKAVRHKTPNKSCVQLGSMVRYLYPKFLAVDVRLTGGGLAACFSAAQGRTGRADAG